VGPPFEIANSSALTPASPPAALTTINSKRRMRYRTLRNPFLFIPPRSGPYCDAGLRLIGGTMPTARGGNVALREQ
jgi:hypothetical protein